MSLTRLLFYIGLARETSNSVADQLPYVVKLLNNRIKKCRGCGSLFSRRADGSVPDPPNNLVIAREERRPFDNITRMSRLQNVYYHHVFVARMLHLWAQRFKFRHLLDIHLKERKAVASTVYVCLGLITLYQFYTNMRMCVR